MVMDVTYTYYLCSDHFTICTNIELLRCTPETNIMLYVNYTSIKNYINVLFKIGNIPMYS